MTNCEQYDVIVESSEYKQVKEIFNKMIGVLQDDYDKMEIENDDNLNLEIL